MQGFFPGARRRNTHGTRDGGGCGPTPLPAWPLGSVWASSPPSLSGAWPLGLPAAVSDQQHVKRHGPLISP